MATGKATHLFCPPLKPRQRVTEITPTSIEALRISLSRTPTPKRTQRRHQNKILKRSALTSCHHDAHKLTTNISIVENNDHTAKPLLAISIQERDVHDTKATLNSSQDSLMIKKTSRTVSHAQSSHSTIGTSNDISIAQSLNEAHRHAVACNDTNCNVTLDVCQNDSRDPRYASDSKTQDGFQELKNQIFGSTPDHEQSHNSKESLTENLTKYSPPSKHSGPSYGYVSSEKQCHELDDQQEFELNSSPKRCRRLPRQQPQRQIRDTALKTLKKRRLAGKQQFEQRKPRRAALDQLKLAPDRVQLPLPDEATDLRQLDLDEDPIEEAQAEPMSSSTKSRLNRVKPHQQPRKRQPLNSLQVNISTSLRHELSIELSKFNIPEKPGPSMDAEQRLKIILRCSDGFEGLEARPLGITIPVRRQRPREQKSRNWHLPVRRLTFAESRPTNSTAKEHQRELEPQATSESLEASKVNPNKTANNFVYQQAQNRIFLDDKSKLCNILDNNNLTSQIFDMIGIENEDDDENENKTTTSGESDETHYAFEDDTEDGMNSEEIQFDKFSNDDDTEDDSIPTQRIEEEISLPRTPNLGITVHNALPYIEDKDCMIPVTPKHHTVRQECGDLEGFHIQNEIAIKSKRREAAASEFLLDDDINTVIENIDDGTSVVPETICPEQQDTLSEFNEKIWSSQVPILSSRLMEVDHKSGNKEEYLGTSPVSMLVSPGLQNGNSERSISGASGQKDTLYPVISVEADPYGLSIWTKTRLSSSASMELGDPNWIAPQDWSFEDSSPQPLDLKIEERREEDEARGKLRAQKEGYQEAADQQDNDEDNEHSTDDRYVHLATISYFNQATRQLHSNDRNLLRNKSIPSSTPFPSGTNFKEHQKDLLAGGITLSQAFRYTASTQKCLSDSIGDGSSQATNLKLLTRETSVHAGTFPDTERARALNLSSLVTK